MPRRANINYFECGYKVGDAFTAPTGHKIYVSGPRTVALAPRGKGGVYITTVETFLTGKEQPVGFWKDDTGRLLSDVYEATYGAETS